MRVDLNLDVLMTGKRMKTLLSSLLLGTCLCVALPASASPAGETLGRCLADHTNGLDRKDLARWMFLAIAAHPEIGSMVKINPADVHQADQKMGRLVTRLLAQDCAREFSAVMKQEGSAGISQGFEFLGRAAMTELMTNRAVQKSISGFQAYTDEQKIMNAAQKVPKQAQ